jgi:hypothetical protein
MSAPTMKPPATIEAPAMIDIGGPGAGCVTSSEMSCFCSSITTAQPTSSRKSGTATFATHCMPWKPRITTAVMIRPNASDHAHTGSHGMIEWRPDAETPDWIPNQPMRLMPMARPMSADPAWPKPVQRDRTEVFSPSRWPMRPVKTHTTSRITAPMVIAQKASQKLMLKPSVAATTNALSAES